MTIILQRLCGITCLSDIHNAYFTRDKRFRLGANRWFNKWSLVRKILYILPYFAKSVIDIGIGLSLLMGLTSHHFPNLFDRIFLSLILIIGENHLNI
jgi:hypothetical protein